MPTYTAQRTSICDAPQVLDFSNAVRVRGAEQAGEKPPTQVPAGSATAARRGEFKYVLDEETYQRFRSAVRAYVEPDAFATSHISSLYLDTEDNSLIRRSLEKPRYKEKLRIRTYQADPNLNSPCFLEIKKKSRGTVYKRRVEMTLREAIVFCRHGIYPETSLAKLPQAERVVSEQILQEIGWMYAMNGELKPSFIVSCKRLSLKERGTDSLRITFDRDVAWSQAGDSYVPLAGEHALLGEGMRIMEIKASAAMPLWLVRILGELEIYPQSFSKVGNSYKSWLTLNEGEVHGL